MMNPRYLIMSMAAVMLACAPRGADAQSAVDDSRRNAIVTAIEKASPAVVTINVVEIRTERVRDPFFDLFGLGGAQLQKRSAESLGSGFLFDEAGHILTNYHVLQDADAISSVTLPDGRNIKVEFIGADERTDLAVLRARDEALPYLALGDSEGLLAGEWVIAIGNPFGNMMRDPKPSVSVGVVSANHRRVSREVGGGDRLYQDLIQTDAAINPGNSGGPLVNARGEAVGINTMLFSNSGGYQGLGFAIPINRAKRVAREIIQYGRRRDPWFGFRGQAVTEILSESLRNLGVTAAEGVLVTEIIRTSPAYQAGLRLGDVVQEVNSEAVSHPTDIDYINWSLFIGDEVRMRVDRQGDVQNLRFVIQEVRE